MSHPDSSVQAEPGLTKVLRLRVTAEPDPGVLPRILANFQNLNLVPRRVVAEFGSSNEMYLSVDITDLSEHRVSIITQKIAQIPSILGAYWHHL